MKYVHGTDEQKQTLLMVWVNRLVFAVILFDFLFFLAYCVSVLICVALNKGSKDILFNLLFAVPGSVVTLLGLHETIWSNARYYLDERGITFVYPMHFKRYAWSAFEKVFIAPIRRGRVSTTYDYIVLMISECGALTRSISVSECWKYQSHFLVVRSTNARIKEFEKYCTISDRPDIPAYKYFY